LYPFFFYFYYYFLKKFNLKVSASDGTNVVSAFNEAIKRGIKYKESEKNKDFVEEVLNFIAEEEKRPDGIFNKKDENELFMNNQASLTNE